MRPLLGALVVAGGLSAGCTPTSSTPRALTTDATVTITISADDGFAGGPYLAGPSVVVFADGRFQRVAAGGSRQLEQGRLAEHELARLVAVAEAQHLFADRSDYTNDLVVMDATVTHLTLTVAAGTFHHDVIAPTSGSTPARLRLQTFLHALDDALNAAAPTPLAPTRWLVLTTDGSGPYPCRVSTTNDDTETTATRPLFPFELDLPVTKLSNLCAGG